MRRTLVLALVCLAACDCGTGDDGPPPSAALTFSPPIVDFGQVALGFASRVRLDVSNVSKTALRIERAAPEAALADEIRLSGVPATLLGQSTATVDVVFTPETVGTRRGKLIFEAGEQAFEVQIVGVAVNPQLVVSHSRVDFGRVVLGSVASATVTLTNQGQGAAKISALTLDPETSSEFIVALDTSRSLDSGESFDFLIQYSPGDRGTDIGRVIVADDAAMPTRVAVAVVGEGIASEIQLEPSVLNFFGALIGETSWTDLELRNVGVRTHTIESVGIAPGPRQLDFVVDLTARAPPFEIAPGEIVRIPVGYRPNDTGLIASALIIESTGLVEPATIELLGRAERAPAPALVIEPSSVDFGTVATGHSTPRRVRAENPGIARLIVEGLPTVDPPGTFFVTEWPGPDTIIGGAQSHTFTAVVTPPGPGTHRAELVFQTGIETEPEVRLPLVAVARDGAVPDLLVETTTVTFGRIERGITARRRIDLVSVGNAPIDLVSVTIEGPEAFRVVSPTDAPRRLSPGERTTIEVDFFNPDGLADTSTAALVIMSTDPDAARFVVGMVATTVQPRDNPMLRVDLTWTPPEADLDLHFIRDGGARFDRPGDCCFCNPAPEWTFGGSTEEDPVLLADTADGVEGETVVLPVAGGLFFVDVHDVRTSSTPVLARIVVRASGQVVHAVERSMVGGRAWRAGQIEVFPQSGVANFFENKSPLVAERRDRCF